MNFGKIALGALLLAIGALLLAVRTGFAHPDTPVFLLRYWPVLLIAFGLAFLGSAIKNPFLGVLAVLVILGGAAFGIYWVNQHKGQGKEPVTISTIGFEKTRVESLSVRVRTFAGRFYINRAAPPSKKLTVCVRTISESAPGHRFDVTGGKAVFEWPLTPGTLGFAPPGTSLAVLVPEAMPVSLSWRGRLASVHADLSRLRPKRCAFHGIASEVLLGINGATRPQEIRVSGVCSNITIRIQGDCPVWLVSRGAFVMTSLPSDFMEHARGRGKDRVVTGEGRGPPVRIYAEGPFVRVKIERFP